MGLESINFFFHSDEEIESKIILNKEIIYCNEKKYVYKKEGYYWIDLEFQDLYSLSLRIALCNPEDSVLKALYNLLLFLFSFKGGKLIDMTTKQIYTAYNENMKQDLENSYLNRKEIFQEIYGNYMAAINSEEFYRRQGKIEK